MKFYLHNILICTTALFISIVVQGQESASEKAASKSSVSIATQDYDEITSTWKETTFSSKQTLIENLNKSELLTYYTTLFESPSLQRALKGIEMMTVFVVVNEFFEQMDEEQREAFLSQENSDFHAKAISNLIIPGRLDSRTLLYEIEKRNGQPVTLKTLSGNPVVVYAENETLILKSEDGFNATVLASNFSHANGFFHIIDNLLVDIPTKN